MGLFGKKVIVPEWAAFFGEKEYAVFLKAVDLYFKGKLKLKYEMEDGIVKPGENPYGLSNLGLMNVARMCHQGKVAEYSRIVEYHFNLIKESSVFKMEFKKIEKDFEQVKKYLAVRIYEYGYLETVGMDKVISRSFADDLCAVLVYDFPTVVETVSVDNRACWDKSPEELFVIGIENVRRNYSFSLKTVGLEQGKDSVLVCETKHMFAPNLLFDIREHLDLIGTSGSLVAIPSRSLVVIYPINDISVALVINRFFNFVPNMFVKYPGSLTKNIYWYKDESFTKLPYEPVGDQVKFFPPQAFLDELNRLAPADQHTGSGSINCDSAHPV